MHKFTVVFATLATATATTIAFAQPQEPAKTIESLMQAAHSIGVFNGNVLVAYKGKAIYEQSFGYADAARSRPLSADDLFYLGSITKEFNGAGILLLEQQGKLQLTDKVSRHLPGYPAWAENIEIKDLLNYTSGLPDIAGDTDAAMQDSILKIQKLAFPPGTAYLYSYANVFLQRRIIEKVSGVSYAAFVKKEILQPCHVAGGAEDSSKRLIAAPFTNALKPVAMNVAETPGDFLTARDLYNWATCLSGGKLLNERSLEKLGIAFGSGESSLGAAQFESGKFRTHQHQGSGFNNEALLFTSADDETAVILLTNNQNFKLYQLKDAILAILHAQPYTVPKKSIYLDIREPLAADFQDGIATYLRLRESGKDTYDFAAEPFDLINTGRYLMRREKYDSAIAIFEISITFPLKPTDQSFAFALIAEAWSKKGNTPMARVYYEKALQLDPENKSAKGMLDQLTGR